MTDISLVTATGDRPEAFALLEKWMSRQTHMGYQWIVVDDGREATKPTMGQTYIKLDPAPLPKESFRKNLLVGLELCQHPMVLFIEDDEYYSHWYVEMMRDMLKWRPLAGEAHAKYYHVRHRMFRIHPNGSHASLCQTGFSGDDIKGRIQRYLRDDKHPERLDGALWKRLGVRDHLKVLTPVTTHSIAIKGMPGRGGLGIHHSFQEIRDGGYVEDFQLQRLKAWLGADADHYAPYYEPPDEEVLNNHVGGGI